MNKMIRARVGMMKENMHKMIKTRVIKVNMNNNMEKKVVATYLFNIHTSVHQSSLGCSNQDLNTTQHYYVNMLHSPPMTENRAEENLVINLRANARTSFFELDSKYHENH
jgi:hypothetical protein